MYVKNDSLIQAFLDMKKAYRIISCFWNDVEVDRGKGSLNDFSSVALYPFDKSFDELNIVQWIDEVLEDLKPNKCPEKASLIGTSEIHNLLKILHEKRDDIGCVSTSTLHSLTRSLRAAEYVLSIQDFYKHVIDSMPPIGMPNDEGQYDIAMEKFYDAKWTISFNGKSVTIENEAVIYNGIEDTLKELLDYCL